MARRTNFNYEKRQKEIRKQKKRQEKLEAKRLRKEAEADGTATPAVVEMVDPDEFLGLSEGTDGGAESTDRS